MAHEVNVSDSLSITAGPTDLVTNGVFTDWTGGVPDDWDVDTEGTGVVTEVGTGEGYGGSGNGFCNLYNTGDDLAGIEQEVVAVIGQRYIVHITVDTVTTGTITVYESSAGMFSVDLASPGTYAIPFVATAVDPIISVKRKVGGGACDITFDDVSVKRPLAEITPSLVSESDSLTVDDTKAVSVPVLEEHATDSLTVDTNVIISIPILMVNVSDSLTATTSTTEFLARYEAHETDNLTTDDADHVGRVEQVNVSDSLTVTDSRVEFLPIYEIHATDDLTIDSATTQAQTLYEIHVSDDLTVDGADHVGQIEQVSVSDDLTVTDSVPTVQPHIVKVSDDLTVAAGTSEYLTIYEVHTTDSLSITTATIESQPLYEIHTTDSLTVTDTQVVPLTLYELHVSDSLTANGADHVGRIEQVHETDDLTLDDGQLVALAQYEAHEADSLTVRDAVEVPPVISYGGWWGRSWNWG